MQNYLKRKNEINLLDDSSWFKDFFQNPFFKPENLLKTDVIENPDTYTLVMDAPGVKTDEVKISCEDGYLTVEVNQHNDKEATNTTYVRKERSHGIYSRSYYIGSNIDTKDIYATFSNGVLYISVPKQKETSSIRYIPIQEK